MWNADLSEGGKSDEKRRMKENRKVRRIEKSEGGNGLKIMAHMRRFNVVKII